MINGLNKLNGKIKVKLWSINDVFQGRRYKVKDYKEFEEKLLMILPNIVLDKKKDLTLYLEVGFSSKNADLSNTLKMVEDVLAVKFCFNDRDINHIVMDKVIMPKGEEYFYFEIY